MEGWPYISRFSLLSHPRYLLGVQVKPGKKLQQHEERRKVVHVKGLPLAEILNDVPLPNYDYVQIDVEGFDEQVLHQLLALPWRPSMLCMETLSAPGRRLLLDAGFDTHHKMEFPDQQCWRHMGPNSNIVC